MERLTPTDLVFPLFMFIMGVSTYLSLRKYDFACSGAAVRKILGPHGGDFRRRSGRRLVLALLLLDAVACRAGRSAVGARGALGEQLRSNARNWAYCSGWRSATEREP